MAWDSNRAIFPSSALGLYDEFASHGIVVARSAVPARATCTGKNGDRATVHAFPINELVSVPLTHIFAEAQLEDCTLLAIQVLFGELSLRVHSLLAIFHASKVGLLTPVTLVEGAVVDCEVCQLAVVDVPWCHDSPTLVVTFFLGHLHAQKADQILLTDLLVDLVGDDWDVVVELNRLLAGRAIKVTESDLHSRPLMIQHHQNAIRMEHVTTGHSNAGLFSKLGREADASKLGLCCILKHAGAHRHFHYLFFFDNARFIC